MPLTSENTAGLVAGAAPQKPTALKVRLLKAICVGGKRIEPGVVEVDKAFAAFLVGANKAVRHTEEPKPEPQGEQNARSTSASRNAGHRT
jgi:hypothetical protein